ncbi:MAG: AzlD domain-containing protein [Clostridia bacterium]|nr:AzlD domain-containing protein [Clostridia bacterium]
MNEAYIWLTVAAIALVTAAIRFLPFAVFNGGRKTPRLIEKLGGTLPYAIMGMLVVYCLKDMRFTAIEGFLPQLISCAVVGILYLWRRNKLLSIVTGTVCYMLLVQLVF